jgi:hypothetical protein
MLITNVIPLFIILRLPSLPSTQWYFGLGTNEVLYNSHYR